MYTSFEYYTMYSSFSRPRCHRLSLLQSTQLLLSAACTLVTINIIDHSLPLTGVNSCCVWPPHLTTMLCILYSDQYMYIQPDPFCIYLYLVRKTYCMYGASLAWNVCVHHQSHKNLIESCVAIGTCESMDVYYSSQYDSFFNPTFQYTNAGTIFRKRNRGTQ